MNSPFCNVLIFAVTPHFFIELFIVFFFLFQSSPYVFQLFVKEFLSDILDFLELDSAKYLEQAKKFEVVDFNFDCLLLVMKKYHHLIQLQWNYEAVASDGYNSWSDSAD